MEGGMDGMDAAQGKAAFSAEHNDGGPASSSRGFLFFSFIAPVRFPFHILFNVPAAFISRGIG